jgi:quercetin dioxygenase-like cupin family protein
MIRCIKGRIKVVYEDQGEPFWLEAGDWVIQPPEIRHRVLECTAGAEVIEISMPAEHETWVDHDMDLPTDRHRPDREFSGQQFVRFIAPKA